MTSSQIIISVLIISLLLKTSIVYFKKKNLPLNFFLFWVIFWLLGLFLVNNLPVLSTLSKFLKIGRGVDLAIYFSIIIIFYLIYHLVSENYRLKRIITEIIRHLAIKEYEKKKNKINSE